MKLSFWTVVWRSAILGIKGGGLAGAVCGGLLTLGGLSVGATVFGLVFGGIVGLLFGLILGTLNGLFLGSLIQLTSLEQAQNPAVLSYIRVACVLLSSLSIPGLLYLSGIDFMMESRGVINEILFFPIFIGSPVAGGFAWWASRQVLTSEVPGPVE